MIRYIHSAINLKVVASLLVLFLFLGCKKQDSCKDVIQDDFELVE